jgi:hypothetical protein
MGKRNPASRDQVICRDVCHPASFAAMLQFNLHPTLEIRQRDATPFENDAQSFGHTLCFRFTHPILPALALCAAPRFRSFHSSFCSSANFYFQNNQVCGVLLMLQMHGWVDPGDQVIV